MDALATGGVDKFSANAKKWFGVESADQAELTNLIGKQVITQLRPTFGAQFTAKEGDWLKDMEAGWGTSTAGNRRLLDQGIKLANLRADLGQQEAIRRKDAGAIDQIEGFRHFSLDTENKPQDGNVPRGTSNNPQVGAIVEHGGKRYRIVGGDPNDPDVEEVQ